MKGRFLTGSNESFADYNIFADKSSLVLNWILMIGINKKNFSIREVAREVNVSIGLIQRVFQMLVIKGYLKTEGTRTAKKFFIKKPNLLLQSWINNYNIIKKCKMWTYRSGLQGKEKMIKALSGSNLSQKVVLSLHSAAEAYKCKNTNLNTLEIYIKDSSIRHNLEEVLQLEPQERGYEVLIVKPYYKSLLDVDEIQYENIKVSPALLTFLDLYHFPVSSQKLLATLAILSLSP